MIFEESIKGEISRVSQGTLSRRKPCLQNKVPQKSLIGGASSDRGHRCGVNQLGVVIERDVPVRREAGQG